jgi:hypothetical protein
MKIVFLNNPYSIYNNSASDYKIWTCIEDNLVCNGCYTFYKEGEDSYYTSFYKNGVYHRIDGPAEINQLFTEWHYNGLLHRDNGPAIIWNDNNCDDDYYYYGVRAKNKEEFYNENWRQSTKLSLIK